MKATARKLRSVSPDIAARVDAIDWTQATADLDAQGCAVLKGLLSPDECAALAALYPDDSAFPQPGRDGRATASAAASTNISPIRCPT